jgi:hypothetical protein
MHLAQRNVVSDDHQATFSSIIAFDREECMTLDAFRPRTGAALYGLDFHLQNTELWRPLYHPNHKSKPFCSSPFLDRLWPSNLPCIVFSLVSSSLDVNFC